MSRHDYDLPPDWEAMTDEEKVEWFTQERARRQALSQDTNLSRQTKKLMERAERRAEARNETVDVER